MFEDNKTFFSAELFTERVKKAMNANEMNLDILFRKINDIGYKISKNNLGIYIQRTPNTNFLIALSKALNVTTDYLLGISDENKYLEGFNHNIESRKYKKYDGDYSFYFYPTANSRPEELNKANLVIKNNHVMLKYKVNEEEEKEYCGELTISDNYSISYIVLYAKSFGEMIAIYFMDPAINSKKNMEFCVGAMLSVSSGALRRTPVMSRCILSKRDISNKYFNSIKANLLLNTKYINILELNFEDAVKKFGNSCDKNYEMVESILKRAFTPKTAYVIEESYILNTLKNECDLSDKEALELLDLLRLNSIHLANSKLYASLDTRLYQYFFETDSNIEE